MFGQRRKPQYIRPAAIILTTVLATAVVIPAGPAEGLESGVCRVEVLVDGKPLTEYLARGTTYIEALQGREYALRLTNLADRRIAVALAVDGLNSIDAKTSSASKASNHRIQSCLTGWRLILLSPAGT